MLEAEAPLLRVWQLCQSLAASRGAAAQPDRLGENPHLFQWSVAAEGTPAIAPCLYVEGFSSVAGPVLCLGPLHDLDHQSGALVGRPRQSPLHLLFKGTDQPIREWQTKGCRQLSEQDLHLGMQVTPALLHVWLHERALLGGQQLEGQRQARQERLQQFIEVGAIAPAPSACQVGIQLAQEARGAPNGFLATQALLALSPTEKMFEEKRAEEGLAKRQKRGEQSV